MVEEFMVTTGPIAQVGCARACSTVTCSSCSLVKPRNGPPLAVKTNFLTSGCVPERKH